MAGTIYDCLVSLSQTAQFDLYMPTFACGGQSCINIIKLPTSQVTNRPSAAISCHITIDLNGKLSSAHIHFVDAVRMYAGFVDLSTVNSCKCIYNKQLTGCEAQLVNNTTWRMQIKRSGPIAAM